MSKITLSVIVYAPCLNKTTIKSNKKRMISSADTFFWMTRYKLRSIIIHFTQKPKLYDYIIGRTDGQTNRLTVILA